MRHYNYYDSEKPESAQYFRDLLAVKGISLQGFTITGDSPREGKEIQSEAQIDSAPANHANTNISASARSVGNQNDPLVLKNTTFNADLNTLA